MKRPTLGTYFRTLWHLRPSQIFWRVAYTLESSWAIPVGAAFRRRLLCASDNPHLREDFPDVPLVARTRSRGRYRLDDLVRGDFVQMHSRKHFDSFAEACALDTRGQDRLWSLEFHCHPWVYALAEIVATGGKGCEEAGRLLIEYLSNWITHFGNGRHGRSRIAGNSFVVASRLAWWIRSYHLLGDRWFRNRLWFRDRILDSVVVQARWLEKHIEWDLRANHLLKDAVGLAWAGRFFEGPEAAAWTLKAKKIALAQIDEQVLADGGHFEGSTMYHIQVMEDLLTLAYLFEEADARSACVSAWARMADFLAWIVYPDGTIPLLSDAADDWACNPLVMLGHGPRLGVKVAREPRGGGRLFEESGLFVWRGTPWTCFLDLGRVGPEVQLGHAHADSLTLECSFNGIKLFVDPGTYAYDDDDVRIYDRSTAAHNTVVIDGIDSSECWSVFRTGRCAYPLGVQSRFTPDSAEVTAAHDGYSHRPGRPIHRRTLFVRNAGELRIVDDLQGSGYHQAEGGFLLDPRWTAHPKVGGWVLTSPDLKLGVSVRSSAAVRLAITSQPYHPQFGVEKTTLRLGWALSSEFPSQVETRVAVAA